MSEAVQPQAPKAKKSVALSGVTAGNTALCTVGRTGNDLHYRGYDILDVATTCEFEEIAYLLVHGKLPNQAELKGYKAKLKSLRGLPLSMTRDNKSVLACNLSFLSSEGERLRAGMQWLLERFADGRLRPPPVTTFPLERAADAQRAYDAISAVSKRSCSVCDPND